jgi:hypothetical protein
MDMLFKYFTDRKTDFIRSSDQTLMKELRVGPRHASQVYTIRVSNVVEMFPSLKQVFQLGENTNDEHTGAEEIVLKVYNFMLLKARYDEFSELVSLGMTCSEPEEVADVEESALKEIECLERIEKYNTGRDAKEMIHSTDVFASGYYRFGNSDCAGIFIVMPYLRKDPVTIDDLVKEHSRCLRFSWAETKKIKAQLVARYREAVRVIAQLEMIGIHHNDTYRRNMLICGGVLYIFDFSHSILIKPSKSNDFKGSKELKIRQSSRTRLKIEFLLLL